MNTLRENIEAALNEAVSLNDLQLPENLQSIAEDFAVQYAKFKIDQIIKYTNGEAGLKTEEELLSEFRDKHYNQEGGKKCD